MSLLENPNGCASSQHLTAILEFMYAGEVNVAQDQLPQFLKTAERLKVGLSTCRHYSFGLD